MATGPVERTPRLITLGWGGVTWIAVVLVVIAVVVVIVAQPYR